MNQSIPLKDNIVTSTSPCANSVQRKIAFVTNMCSHYSVKLFELFSEKYHADFFFTGGDEDYWERGNKQWMGNFHGQYLKGFYIFPKIKIIPGLWKLRSGDYKAVIKTIDGRFELPFVFLLTKLQRKPFILYTQMWMHPKTFFHKISFVFLKVIYKYSDAIIVYGEHVKNYLNVIGIRPEKIYCAPQAIDNTLFNHPVSEQDKKALKEQLGCKDRKIVLYVGRLEECKGLTYLIEAVSFIKDLDFCMLFIGTGSLRNSLEKSAQEASLKTIFLNHIPNEQLNKYYAIADIFVLPSITIKSFKEPWGMVINEAMNQGCPVIVTNAVGAGAGGLVEDGQNGYIVPEKDSMTLKEAIDNLLRNEQLRSRMGQNSTRKIAGWTLQETMKGFQQAIDFVTANDKRM